jgi:hypothetical protein
MNYAYLIPGAQGNPAAFVANTTLDLGYYDKALEAETQISVDYSALIPAVTLVGYSFRVRPGGEPQLWLTDSAITGNVLTFYVNGGIGGRSYDVVITAKLSTGEIRSDKLTVNVLGDACGCPPHSNLVISTGATTGDGGTIVNTSPRFFVSSAPPVGAHLLDRWYDTSTGAVYDYISDGVTSFWQISGTVGGGGGGGGAPTNIIKILPLTPDGITTTFTMTRVGGPVVVAGSNSLFVSVDGVWQEADVQYTAASSQIVFTDVPAVDASIFILWFAPPGI